MIEKRLPSLKILVRCSFYKWAAFFVFVLLALYLHAPMAFATESEEWLILQHRPRPVPDSQGFITGAVSEDYIGMVFATRHDYETHPYRFSHILKEGFSSLKKAVMAVTTRDIWVFDASTETFRVRKRAEIVSESHLTGDTYYDEEAERWRSRSFDRDWNKLLMGRADFQARMRREGYIWDPEQGGWVHPEVKAKPLIEKYSQQALNRAMDLPLQQQEIVERIVRKIRNTKDPVEAAALMQRLRNGTHLMASAERDRALSEVADLEQGGVVLDTMTMLTPFLNDARDIEELWTGKDIWTDRELEWWERGLTALGVIAGSGAAFRSAFRSRNAAVVIRSVDDLTPGARRAINKVKDLAADSNKLDAALHAAPDIRTRRKLYQKMQREAEETVENLERALKTNDEKRITQAVLDVKGNWEAIKVANKRPEGLKRAINQRLQKINDLTDAKVRKKTAKKFNEQIAQTNPRDRERVFTPNQQHGQGTFVGEPGNRPRRANQTRSSIEETDIEVFCASNPSDQIKVGKDRDYTLRVFGQDVPSDEARRIYNEALYETIQELDVMPRHIQKPSELGSWLDQTPFTGWKQKLTTGKT